MLILQVKDLEDFKSKLIALCHTPDQVSTDDMDLLKYLTRVYPFFQAPKLFLAKLTSDNEKIKKAAIYSLDRNLLRQLCQDKIELEKANFTTEDEADNNAQSAQNTLNQSISTQETDLYQNRKSKIQNTYTNDVLSHSEQQKPEDISKEIISLSDMDIDEPGTDEALQVQENLEEGLLEEYEVAFFEQNHKTEKIKSTTPVTQEANTGKPKKTDEEKTTSVHKSDTEVEKEKKPKSADIENETNKTTTKNIMQYTEKKPFRTEGNDNNLETQIRKRAGFLKSTARWFKSTSKLSQEEQVPDNETSSQTDKKRVVGRLRSSRPKFQWFGVEKKQNLKEENYQKPRLDKAHFFDKNKDFSTTTQDTVINAFMNYLKHPKDQTGKEDNQKEETNLAHESETIHFDTVTESLAKIMVIQQKYREAIKIYQTLQLKNTTKHAYFAKKIEQLQQFIT